MIDREYGLSKLRERFIDFKPQLKYYIPKDLYDLIDYAILYRNNWNLELFSFSPDYKDIWSKLRVYDNYGHCKLLELGYDENYYCYCVDVVCADLLDYLYHMHDYYTSPSPKKVWMDRALRCGWSEEEVAVGWEDYHRKCRDAFNRRHRR